MATIRELAETVAEEKLSWDRARLNLDKARSEYEYAKRKLVLASQLFSVEFHAHPDPLSEGVLPRELWDALNSVSYLGDPIGKACNHVLGSMMVASTEEIADRLMEGGFEFKSSVPVREVHAALLKQPWAKKNKDTGLWEWEDYFLVKEWKPEDSMKKY